MKLANAILPKDEITMLHFPQVWVNLTLAEVTHRSGERCSLSPRESELLTYLALKGGLPSTRDELLTHVWKLDASRTVTRTVDMHISLLRRKLWDNSEKPELIITVFGHGYVLGEYRRTYVPEQRKPRRRGLLAKRAGGRTS